MHTVSLRTTAPILRSGLGLKDIRHVTSLVQNEVQSREHPVLDSSASTLVIGGGIAGTSIAYHLAKQGQKGVMLLEKTELTAGSTWHAAGLTSSYNNSLNMKRVQYESLNLYSKIVAETGQEISFQQPGSIRIAQTPKTVEGFRYQMAKAGLQNTPMHLLSPDQIKKKIPFIREDKILMGLHTPYDGYVDPYSLTQALAKGAKKYGAAIHQNTEVTALNLKHDGRWSVSTSKGDVIADRVVNAAGFWAKELAKMAGLDLPLVVIEHQYIVTSTIPEIQSSLNTMPVFRFVEASSYIRKESDGLLVGPYESLESTVAKTNWNTDGVPKGFGKELFPSDIDRIMPKLEQLMEVIPPLSSANIKTIVNGPMMCTADGLPIVGPSTLPNMWFAVGFGLHGILLGGGIGQFLTAWIQNGEPIHDLTECDPGRYGGWTTEDFVAKKAKESYANAYAIPFPPEEISAGPSTSRITTAYEKQKLRGARMAFVAGWQNPAYFASPNQEEYKPSFGRSSWHSEVKREWEAVKGAAGIIDLSSLGKYILEGPQASQFLDFVTANSVPSLNRCVTTHLLTPSGKVYSELTVTSLEENKFLITTKGSSEIRDLRWMKENARTGNWNVNLKNISDEFGCLSVAGPKSEEILSTLNPNFNQDFSLHALLKMDIYGIETTTLKKSNTGEQGWEIYHPKKETGKLYDLILEAGEKLGLSDFGSLTMNVLRLEKGLRIWGKEISHNTDIIEAGLLSYVDMSKKDFIGKTAVVKLLKEQPKRELVMVKLDPKSQYDPQGGETVSVAEKVVGNTTSGCFSYLLGQPIAFVYLPPFLSTPGTIVQVQMMSSMYDAEVMSQPPDVTYSGNL